MFNWRISAWLQTLQGLASELYNSSVHPSNLDHAPPLKKQWSLFFFCCSWINQHRFSGNGGSKLPKLCVAPSPIWINIFSELCVLDLDHHTGLLFWKYCRKCRIQILWRTQHQNKQSVNSTSTQNTPPKNRRNLSWFWKWLLLILEKLFLLSARRNQVKGVDSRENVAFFTIYTIGQKITSGLRKQHMLPRLAYMLSLTVQSCFIQVLKQWK